MSGCRLDKSSPAAESLGDAMTDWRSKQLQDSPEAGLRPPRDFPDGGEPAANHPRGPWFGDCSITNRNGLPQETEQPLQTPCPASRQCAFPQCGGLLIVLFIQMLAS